ncbi:MAG: glycoside hydrolase family 38 C-terminal domain-containing protein, partial [Armatimonadota bacterium]|nr:glycoside hydrolase family 38 C-terminal domain-containing protein [Armatimonadota bacterium]
AKTSAFLQAAREGRIGCQAIYGNMLTGICSHESLIRDLYFAHFVAKKYGIPFDIAMSSDVPTQVWTLPTILAQSGIKYFSAGLNLTRGNSFDKLFDKSPFYWQGPDGSKVLTWYMNGYAKADQLGLTVDIEHAKTGIETLLRQYDREDYPFDAVLGFGGYGDNQRLGESLAKVVSEWNERYAFPRIIFCRGPEFFKYIEGNFKNKIPTISGDGGVYWEDGAGSSARETALVRIAKENIVAAEKIFSLASIIFGEKCPKAEFEAAWKNAILYDEHTWGAHCSISQPKSEQTVKQWAYKARFSYDASQQAKKLVESGLRRLACMVKADTPSLLVFNTLDAPMSGLVRTRDGSGRLVELWAENVPSLGYRLYPLSAAKALNETFKFLDLKSHVRTTRFENRFYRLELDPKTGVVKSLYDKELKRELVDSKSPYGLNRYLYVSGHGSDMNIHAEVCPAKVSVASIPYRTIIRIESSVQMTPEIITEIVLWDNIKRIDFNNTLRKKATYAKEAGYFAFPFAFENPNFFIEIPNGIIQPTEDMFPGACMQWYCTQDFVAVSEPGCTIVWTAIESPLITLCDINRDTFQSPLPIENGHLYAYVFNNYWFTNYKASQSGQLTFRFSLTSMREYDPAMASRFGRSVRNPLLVAKTLGKGKSTVYTTSLLTVKPSNVIIQAVKPAEFSKGLIVRLREVAGRNTEATLQLPAGIKKAWECNLVEDFGKSIPISAGVLKVKIRSHGIATVLISP